LLSVHHRQVDTVIANVILKKGTRGSFHQWTKDNYNLDVISFPGIGRIFVSGGTKNLVS
jgi:hypothetical protein